MMEKWMQKIHLSIFFNLMLATCSLASEILCLSDGIHQCEFHQQLCTRNITEVSKIPANANNFGLQFCSTLFLLQDDINIFQRDSITIQGSPTVINCKTNTSGIHISQVSNLVITDITISQCGSLFEAFLNNSGNTYFASSIYIHHSSNITLYSVTTSDSQGTGLLMISNKGMITINNCNFENSSSRAHDKALANGAGLHIELFYCGPGLHKQWTRCNDSFYKDFSKTVYRITNCSFLNNNDISNEIQDLSLSTSGWGRGGGLSIVANNNTFQINITITKCNILYNRATWGGGLYLAIYQAYEIDISIEECTFTRNECPNNAGGAVNVGFVLPSSTNNSIHFVNCQFLENKAYYGGGVSVFAERNTEETNIISFIESSWTGNKANFGAAADFSPQNLNTGVFSLQVVIKIVDCNFTNNIVPEHSVSGSHVSSGKGTVWIERLRMIFSGQIVFTNNSGSALYVISGKIEFQRNSSVKFLNNSGFQGGAIALIGFSMMVYEDYSLFEFINNVAQDGGGAIYHAMYSQRDIHTSKTCFLQSMENNCKHTEFIFQNNSGSLKGRNNTDLSHYGHSIYSTTLRPCYHSQMKEKSIISEEIFTRTGNFTFVDQNEHDLSTSEYNVTLASNISCIPGKYFILPIEVLDEFGNQIATIYHVVVKDNSASTISVNSDYTYISNNHIIFYGRPRDKAIVTLTTVTIREHFVQFELEMLDCPPGYVYYTRLRSCVCSADLKLYEGITACNQSTFQSKLSSGYWAGYAASSTSVYGKESDFLLSYCPQSQCFGDSLNVIEHTLPLNSSREEMDNLICGANRTGILCSKCRKGFAIHYHSGINQCKKIMNNCTWGWMYYILSELIPVTLIFLVITIFGIKLTSGSIGGFILFMQISVTMRIQNNGHIVFPMITEHALRVYLSIASMFRLSFFHDNNISFCLWKSASNLDILAFKYITIFYALLLIIGIVAVTKCCNVKISSKLCWKSQQDYRSSIVHGISGFLIICYSECIRISLFLLTPVQLYSMSLDKGTYWIKTVPFYDGTLTYFKDKHLAYALPALMIFITIGIISPLLLLSYPLCYKLLACLKLNESKIIKILCLVIPLEKGKPFFDSFQSCFRDDCRFFSGLYFVYRLTTLLAFAFISEPLIFYIILEVQFIVISLAQVLFQPHRNKWHGILDALLFANLSVTNLLTMINQNLSHFYSSKHGYINVISTLQVILLYIPLVYVCFYLGHKIVHRIRRRQKGEKAENDYQLFSYSMSLMNAAEERMSAQK